MKDKIFKLLFPDKAKALDENVALNKKLSNHVRIKGIEIDKLRRMVRKEAK